MTSIDDLSRIAAHRQQRLEQDENFTILQPTPAEKVNGMNLSASIFLIDDSVRAVKVIYDPKDDARLQDNKYTFKTFDTALKKDDYVVVPTATRVGFTVCRIVEVDVEIDYDANYEYKWIVTKVDHDAYRSVIEQEKTIIDKVRSAETNRKRNELRDALIKSNEGLKALKLDVTALPSPDATAVPEANQ